MNSTNLKLVGTKVEINFGGVSILVTIDALSTAYPKSAYSVTWSKEDNPEEIFTTDCHLKSSIIHYSQIILNRGNFSGILYSSLLRKKLRLDVK